MPEAVNQKNQTLVFILLPTGQQKEHLLKTVETFNRATQFVADESARLNMVNKVTMQPLVYRELRRTFGLPSQMAVRSISKAIEERKKTIMSVSRTWRRRGARTGDTQIPHTEIGLHSPVPYDQLMLSFPDVYNASILGINGRERIPCRYCFYGEPTSDGGPPRGELIYDSAQNIFFIHYHIPASARVGGTSEPSLGNDEPVVVETAAAVPAKKARRGRPAVTAEGGSKKPTPVEKKGKRSGAGTGAVAGTATTV